MHERLAAEQMIPLPCSEITESLLRFYLERNLAANIHDALKHHLDQCAICHDHWNRFRWDQAKGTPGYTEFVRYMQEQGEPLLEYLDSSRALITEWRALPFHSQDAREAFFRSTPYYVYNLVIWHESGHRPAYIANALPVLRQLGAQVICDFGCGVGSDGLRFLSEGYQVIFCEFENPASRFLRWRLQQRRLDGIWTEPATLLQERPFDTLWAMDVFDHVPDLHALIPVLERCRIVCCENDSAQKIHGGESYHIQHPPFLLAQLLSHCGFHQIYASMLLSIWSKTALPENEARHGAVDPISVSQ